MNQKIYNIYMSILKDGMVPYQYLYQRLKGKLTGNHEFMLRASDGGCIIYITRDPGIIVQDQMTIDLDGKYVDPRTISITLIGLVDTRRKVYKNTVKWCIRYVWKSVKDYVKIGS